MLKNISELSGSDALIKALENEQVEGIFGLPGGANLPIYDSLYDSDIPVSYTHLTLPTNREV